MSTLDEFLKLIEDANAISIYTHINPDADTLGTALGLYEILKNLGKRVEVVNPATNLPKALDFLPHYRKVKSKASFESSLVITCDCGSLDRVGFTIDTQEIINIDHHHSNTNFGLLNIVDANCASTSQVAYTLLQETSYMNQNVATCFYTSLVADTNFFTTASTDAAVFAMANDLLEAGVDAKVVAYNLTQRKSLASLRILQMTLETLVLHCNAQLAMVLSSEESMKASGASMVDLDGIVEQVRSLATVEIAVHMMQTKSGFRVSLRSKGIDISTLAKAFGGGGHKLAAGFSVASSQTQDLEGTILQKVLGLGLLGEKS